VTFKLNNERTAAVSLEVFWIPVGPDTPRGVSMLLISEAAGVLQKGMYDPNDKFFTHWFPNPKLPKKA